MRRLPCLARCGRLDAGLRWSITRQFLADYGLQTFGQARRCRLQAHQHLLLCEQFMMLHGGCMAQRGVSQYAVTQVLMNQESQQQAA